MFLPTDRIYSSRFVTHVIVRQLIPECYNPSPSLIQRSFICFPSEHRTSAILLDLLQKKTFYLAHFKALIFVRVSESITSSTHDTRERNSLQRFFCPKNGQLRNFCNIVVLVTSVYTLLYIFEYLKCFYKTLCLKLNIYLLLSKSIFLFSDLEVSRVL